MAAPITRSFFKMTGCVEHGSGSSARTSVFHERVDRVMEDAVQAMRDSGADIVDEVELPTQQGPGNPGFELMLYEFKVGLDDFCFYGCFSLTLYVAVE